MERGAPWDNYVIGPQEEEQSSLMFINQLTKINHINTFSKGNGNKQNHMLFVSLWVIVWD